eukprot:scaffold612164_cov153-Attheya_sp.AAC.1
MPGEEGGSKPSNFSPALNVGSVRRQLHAKSSHKKSSRGKFSRVVVKTPFTSQAYQTGLVKTVHYDPKAQTTFGSVVSGVSGVSVGLGNVILPENHADCQNTRFICPTNTDEGGSGMYDLDGQQKAQCALVVGTPGSSSAVQYSSTNHVAKDSHKKVTMYDDPIPIPHFSNTGNLRRQLSGNPVACDGVGLVSWSACPCLDCSNRGQQAIFVLPSSNVLCAPLPPVDDCGTLPPSLTQEGLENLSIEGVLNGQVSARCPTFAPTPDGNLSPAPFAKTVTEDTGKITFSDIPTATRISTSSGDDSGVSLVNDKITIDTDVYELAPGETETIIVEVCFDVDCDQTTTVTIT